ncbi:phage tail sheath C-terminal domain-containing protein [Pseudomonas sp. CGJS7]|uniref:phage tail sheath C-terminal domain-containing protein n=1 Tax=Pseudomonas sp. CGJS7 TaxID=3109348 RepID=UPI003008B3C0
MADARRLPGIQIDVAPQAASEALPRMDVAVLVGFAATGPLHLPVAVEGPAQYAAVFGDDAALAWDTARGERVSAQLGPAVRAFFANGGRRCWVIRVARSLALERVRIGADAELANDLARSNRFALPGLLAVHADGSIAPASMAARCEGSWSDGLRVDVALEQRGFAVDAWSVVDSPASARYAFLCRQALRPGDLLQLGDDPALRIYARTERVAAGATPQAPYAVEVKVLAAFEALSAASPPAVVAGWASAAESSDPWPALLHEPTPDDPRGEAQLQLQAALDSEPFATGAWLRFAAAGEVSWLRADEIERQPDPSASPATDTVPIRIAARGPAWRELDPGALALAAFGSAQQLQIELRAADAAGLSSRVRPLALTPQRSGNAWELQNDQEHYRQHNDLAAAKPAQLQRFPLAADETTQPLAWLPLGASVGFSAAVGPLPLAGTALERDGLSRYDRDLFLDPDLADDGVATLPGHAEDIRLIRPQTRDLFGLHAAFAIGEGGLFNQASLLALPDAGHIGWHRRIDDIAAPTAVEAGATPAHWRDHRGACLREGDETSEVPLLEPDFGRFLDCDTRLIQAPVLTGPQAPVAPGNCLLSWTQSETDATYALFEAALADFSDEREIHRGAATEHVLYQTREGDYHYRVRAHVGEQSSAPSNPVTVRVRAQDWVQADPLAAQAALEPEWLAIHRAALRLCAASGDLFAALSMPRHFRASQALRYARRLREVRGIDDVFDPLALAFDEARALSYAALYFPWLQSDARSGDGDAGDSAQRRSPLVVPPDGVALGVLAARASRRGAWIAAANEPMRDVIALTPRIDAGERQALQDAQINLLRDDPRGFFALSADTLSLDADLRPINVRRLLILLRRIALRRGSSYVFEPNGPMLWRSVQRGFDQLLGELFRRGAFAGATAEQSFRVVTDEGVNPPGAIDAGRFVVELRVAPSLPMRFIAVRLAQSGERLTVREEL